jgi:hypothetical protein
LVPLSFERGNQSCITCKAESERIESNLRVLTRLTVTAWEG